MGKRELLLAGVFLVLGFLVYQVTAPPGDPNRPNRGVGHFINEIRREIRGNRATAEKRETTTHALSASITEIRVGLQNGAIHVTGEDRSDIEAELYVRSNAYDDQEASQTAKATVLKVDEAGALLIMNVEFPREGRQTATLSLKVPARLAIRMDGKNGPLNVTNVAAVTISTGRGDTAITHVAGQVAITQRGAVVTIDDVGGLRLNTLGGSEARVSNVRGDAYFNLQSGELRAERLAGGLEVESRNAEIQFEKLEQLRGPVRVNAVSGEVTMTDLRTEARIDGRQTDVRVQLGAAVPLAVYNDGGEPVEITLPEGGFKIDALAANARISLDPALEKGGLKVIGAKNDSPGGDNSRREERVTGSVRGGGPAITIRSSRGDIVLKGK